MKWPFFYMKKQRAEVSTQQLPVIYIFERVLIRTLIIFTAQVLTYLRLYKYEFSLLLNYQTNILKNDIKSNKLNQHLKIIFSL